MTKTKTYEMDMTSGPLLGKILIFSLPLMLSGMLQLLFNAADIIVVGRFVGDGALAAVGSTSSLITLLTNLFIGFSVGTNVLTAQGIGAGREKFTSDTVHTSVLFSVICGAALAVVGIMLSEPLLELMGTPEEVIDQAVLYMQIYFAGMPVVMLYNFGNAVMRALGDTRRPMYYLIIAGVINVILNVFFVTQLHMDVAGVALATIISQTVSAWLMVRSLCRLSGSCRLYIKKLRINFAVLKRIIAVGLPAGLQSAVFSISNVLIQSSINLFGKTAVAGNTAASNLEGFVYIAMNAMYQTSVSFASQNYGAGRLERVKRVFWICAATVSVIGISVGYTVYFLSGTLLKAYSTVPEVIEFGILRLRNTLFLHFACGVMDVAVGASRGMGSSIATMIISLIGACGLRIVWIYTIFQMHKTLEVLYMSYPVSWVLTAAVQMLYFMWLYRRKQKLPQKSFE